MVIIIFMIFIIIVPLWTKGYRHRHHLSQGMIETECTITNISKYSTPCNGESCYLLQGCTPILECYDVILKLYHQIDGIAYSNNIIIANRVREYHQAYANFPFHKVCYYKDDSPTFIIIDIDSDKPYLIASVVLSCILFLTFIIWIFFELYRKWFFNKMAHENKITETYVRDNSNTFETLME